MKIYLTIGATLAILSWLFPTFAGTIVMLAVALTILYLGVYRQYEPLLLIPIGFGAFLANIPGGGMSSHSFEAAFVQKSGSENVTLDLDSEAKENTLFWTGDAFVTSKHHKGEKSDPHLSVTFHKKNLFMKPVGEVPVKLYGKSVGSEGISLKDGDVLELGLKTFEVHFEGGLLNRLYMSMLKTGIIPPLIFMGVGAMTDFGPMLRNMGLAMFGAAAQLGIFSVFLVSLLFGYPLEKAASLGIIGGADGPTAVYLTNCLAPDLLGPIAVAAYSYMALVPIIIPLVVRLTTNKEELLINMKAQERRDGASQKKVSKNAKIAFPVMTTLVCGFIVPSSTVLVGSLMFGNFVKEVGIPSVVERLAGVAKGPLINVLTIILGLTVGGTMGAKTFLDVETIGIIVGGFLAFSISIAGGVYAVKIYNGFAKKGGWKLINPLIGATGLSAVPMASRVANEIALKHDKQNNILHYCMASNIAGVVGSAVAAGYFLSQFRG